MTSQDAWTFEEHPNGYRIVTGPGVLFIRWRWGRPWEFYTTNPRARGYWKNRERFYRMLTDAEASQLEACFERARAAERLGPLRMDHVRELAQRDALCVPGCVYVKMPVNRAFPELDP